MYANEMNASKMNVFVWQIIIQRYSNWICAEEWR